MLKRKSGRYIEEMDDTFFCMEFLTEAVARTIQKKKKL